MKLIFAPASPFVRKVRALAHELGIQDSITLHPVKTTALSTADDARAANPLGKIPALIQADGPTLFDSRVICRFLNDKANGDMYPTNTLYDVLTLEALADGIMESGVTIVYETRLRPAEKQSAEWMDAQWSKITSALDSLELNMPPALHGTVNMAQIAMACALSYLDFRHDDRNWRNTRPTLAAWHKAICDRPSLKTTEPTD